MKKGRNCTVLSGPAASQPSCTPVANHRGRETRLHQATHATSGAAIHATHHAEGGKRPDKSAGTLASPDTPQAYTTQAFARNNNKLAAISFLATMPRAFKVQKGLPPHFRLWPPHIHPNLHRGTLEGGCDQVAQLVDPCPRRGFRVYVANGESNRT